LAFNEHQFVHVMSSFVEMESGSLLINDFW
jgi:hypothetical protein